MKTLLLFTILHLCLTSCVQMKIKKNTGRLQYIENCSKKWEFLELRDSVEITIIAYFAWTRADLHSIPGMVIGIKSTRDTVRVLDFSFDNIIYTRNDKVTIIPIDTKKYPDIYIPSILSRNISDDTYYCSVLNTYLGKISPSSPKPPTKSKF